MKIDIGSLDNRPSQFSGEITADTISLDDERIELNSDVEIAVNATFTDPEIELTGEIKADVRLTCSRCLTGIEQEFDFSFRSVFIVPEKFPDDKELELGEADLDIDILPGEEISLADVAREQLLLEIPEMVICSQDCKGLCERCGINRNKETCECGADDIDPRWAALKNLM